MATLILFLVIGLCFLFCTNLDKAQPCKPLQIMSPDSTGQSFTDMIFGDGLVCLQGVQGRNAHQMIYLLFISFKYNCFACDFVQFCDNKGELPMNADLFVWQRNAAKALHCKNRIGRGFFASISEALSCYCLLLIPAAQFQHFVTHQLIRKSYCYSFKVCFRLDSYNCEDVWHEADVCPVLKLRNQVLRKVADQKGTQRQRGFICSDNWTFGASQRNENRQVV